MNFNKDEISKMKQIINIFHLLLFFFSITPFLLAALVGGMVYAQSELDDGEEECEEITNKKAIKLYKKSIKIRGKDQRESIMLLKKAIDIEPDYVDAYYELARMSIWSKNYNAAKKHLLKVIEICPSYNIYAHYYLGDIYYSSGSDDEALKYLKEFIRHPDEIKSDRHYNRAERLIKSAEFFSRIYNNPVPFEPKIVEGICTALDEYLPAISADNEIAFFTRSHEEKNLGDHETKKIEKFIYSERIDGKFGVGNPLPLPFNRGNNEGGATLTIDNKRMYFTICKKLSTGYYNCDIYSAEYIYNDPEEFKKLIEEEQKRFGTRTTPMKDIPEYRWDNIRNIDADLPAGKIGVNSLKAWDSQPSISSDNKTLYFTSDRKGGYGGYDIYKTVFSDSLGYWIEPVNLGPVINTEGNEKSPFIHPDNETFYFSSDNLQGLGGYDIFFAKRAEEKPADTSGGSGLERGASHPFGEGRGGVWKKPKNIGYPINTEEDDLGFFVSTDGKTGYFSSNKTSDNLAGKGGWDLYSFPLYEAARPEKVLFLKGQLKDEQGENLTDAEIELKNVRTRKITKVDVDAESGEYATVVTLEKEDDFIMKVKKDYYGFTARYISTKDTINVASPVKIIDIEMKPIEIGQTFRLDHINFATNSADVLTDESMAVLDDFVEFLNEYPEVKIIIQGHTDDIGSNEDNLLLSRNRAKSVNDYLILSGIGNIRLAHKGFGENKPLANNNTREGRSLNRRTEFVITAM